MAERRLGQGPERQQIHWAVLDLNDGPFGIALSDYQLRIVKPERDLSVGGWRWNADLAVIDPLTFNPDREQGYKGLRDGEEVVLGREYDQAGRFTFPGYVSRRHVSLLRLGDQVEVRDLASLNGTYLLVYDERTETAETVDQATVQHQPDRRPELGRVIVRLAGFSEPSEAHPDRNEDAYFADEASQAIGVFDGVGGQSGSERAAKLAAQAVLECLHNTPPKLTAASGHRVLEEALRAGHRAVVNSGDGIATTATIAKVFNTDDRGLVAIVASVGDSRAYLLEGWRLRHLTLDQAYRPVGPRGEKAAWRLQHTLANATDLSKLRPAERAAFEERHVVTGCLGERTRPPVIVVSDRAVFEGDKLIITSDGVHDNLTDGEIEAIVSRPVAPADVAEALVVAARQRSRDRSHLRAKPDDMTATVMDIRSGLGS